nr:hypothetical protein [Hyphomonas sp.]
TLAIIASRQSKNRRSSALIREPWMPHAERDENDARPRINPRRRDGSRWAGMPNHESRLTGGNAPCRAFRTRGIAPVVHTFDHEIAARCGPPRTRLHRRKRLRMPPGRRSSDNDPNRRLCPRLINGGAYQGRGQTDP